MNSATFYKIEDEYAILPRLLEKIHEQGKRISVMLDNVERVNFVNNLLWTYSQMSFLPHGCYADELYEHQPIWITDKKENLNKANTAVCAFNITDHLTEALFELGFEEIVFITNLNDFKQMVSAEKIARSCMKNSFSITLWEKPYGMWEKFTDSAAFHRFQTSVPPLTHIRNNTYPSSIK
ncbi:DNA polymerase III subunit chi [Candidatus Hydrogenosomobacter endosymbioticus]|uniref:DNA polymerase III subunit chi n=1 Tax=Candidatus Hydrogenosomobacter endosymbioticus TaxID=2558174 RepID=A0ABM7V9S5_9PROT|nr:DNA polymerase III subunit chi [Candidatus Hydrogenosomobacter endosymbioticus]BDB96217.1 DNA polymerase III subunit chi [Candidatus Hydrogenosomobacter endosymbioticus]